MKLFRQAYEQDIGLPIGYTEVEYLESTGTQWIDTGVDIGAEIKLEFSFYATAFNGSTYCAPLSARRTSQINAISYGFNNATTYASFGNNAEVKISPTIRLNTKYVIIQNKEGLWQDGNKTNYAQGYNINFTETSPLYMFARNIIDSSVGNYFIGRIYYSKIWDNGTIVRNFIPVIDPSGTPCMYDLVSRKAFYNQGTGKFIAGRQIHQVEYLESTGTQYIDTGITQNSNIKAELSVYPTVINKFIFGSRVNASTGGFGIFMHSNNDGSWYTFFSAANPMTPGFVVNEKYDIEFSKDGLVVNDNLLEGPYTSEFTGTLNIYLFAMNSVGAIDNRLFIGKIYSTKLYENDVLVRDYVPAVDENGVGFMFDRISHTIFDNAGTGNFTYGKEITKYKTRLGFVRSLGGIPRLPKGFTEVEYLESTGTQYINTEYIPISSNIKYETHIYTPDMPSVEQDIIGYFISGVASNVMGLYSKCVFLYTKANSTTQGDSNVVSKTFTGAKDLYITAELNGNTLTKTLTVNGETTEGTLRAPLSSFSDIKLFTANVEKEKFIGKVYYLKIWENETLVRDFIPVLDWNMRPCLYDLVSRKAFYNQGTGEFTYGRQIHYVEYLATTGTQYINTNIKTSCIWNIGTECTDTTALRNLISSGGYGGQYVASDNSGKWGLGPGITMEVSSTKLTDLTIEFNFESARSEAIITAEGQSLSRADNFPASASLKLWIFMSNTIQGFIGKTYYAKCTDDNGKIVRDYIPAIDENGVGFMFDRVSHTIFDNAGTDAFLYGEKKSTKYALATPKVVIEVPPSEYKRLNYIESTGTQYIDTGIIGRSGTLANIDFEWLDGNIGNDKYILGSASTSVRIYFGTYQSKWQYGYFGYLQADGIQENTRYNAEVSWLLGNGYVNINNERIITSGMTDNRTSDLTLYLFARHQGNSIGSWGAIAKMYGCKIYQDDALVRDFRPVLRRSDNKPGMYDTVNKIFYVNAASGVDFNYG